MRSKYLRLFLTIFSLYCLPSQAIIERNVGVDAGVGFPHLLFAEAQVKIDDRWQMGAGYGALGLLFALPSQTLPSQVITVPAPINQMDMVPIVTPGFNNFSLFLRYFPRQTNFYVHATCHFFQMSGLVTSTLSNSDPLIPITASLNGTATVTQLIQTVGVGYIFSGKIYYLNLSLGMSFFLTSLASAQLLGNLPDVLGGSATVTQINTVLSQQLQDSTNQMLTGLRSQYPVLPSLSLTLGFFL